MSRTYRIQVSEGVQRVVHVEDGVEGAIEVLPILAPERMAELLAVELEKRGYNRTDQGGEIVLVKVGADNVTVEVNVRTGTVKVSIAEDVQVDVTATATGAAESIEAAQAAAKRQVAAELEAAVAPRRDAARKEATAKLEAQLAEARPELDAVVSAAMAEALVEKARELGDIESIEGSVEDGNLTITVRV